jgi:sterol-4alpha-carboxylate 3-dehydrogenase (decarboxylating)
MPESYLVIGGSSIRFEQRGMTDTDNNANAALTGEGFLGHNLVESLIQKYPNATISSLDLVQRFFPARPIATFYSADLTSLTSLTTVIKACSATTVFHTASPWTGSGAELCEKVNVQGTQTIVDACLHEGVRKLIFTSSAGTVYNGLDLINVDERMPFPVVGLDPYNVTKVRFVVTRMDDY